MIFIFVYSKQHLIDQNKKEDFFNFFLFKIFLFNNNYKYNTNKLIKTSKIKKNLYFFIYIFYKLNNLILLYTDCTLLISPLQSKLNACQMYKLRFFFFLFDYLQ